MKYDVSGASFASGLPSLLVESIDVVAAGTTSADQEKRFKFHAHIGFQVPPKRNVDPFRILVVAVHSPSYLETLKTSPIFMRGLIPEAEGRRGGEVSNNRVKMKVVGVDGFSEEKGGLISYSSKQSSLQESRLVNVSFDYEIAPTFLALLALPYRNAENNSTPQTGGSIVIGQPIIETLLRGKQIPLTNRLFRLLQDSKAYGPAGDLWVGATHRHEENLMAGAYHGSHLHPNVETTQTPNQKVKDYRIQQAIDRLPLDKSSPSPWREPSESHFGMVHYSRSYNNEVGIMIPFNLLSYIQQNFMFGRLIKNYSALFSCAVVEDIKIFRTRVQHDGLGTRLTPGKTAPCNDCYKIPPTLIGSLKNGEVSLLDLPGSTGMVQHIFVKDRYMADAKQSKFEYSVEIDVVDNTPKAIQALLKNLQGGIDSYNEYLEALGGNGHLPEDYHTFINVNAARLTTQYNWKKIIIEFISILSFLYQMQSTTYGTMAQWASKMLPFANPYSATPDSAEQLKSLINGYFNRLVQLYAKATLQKSEAPLNVRQKIDAVSSSQRRLKVVYTIDHTYHNNLDPHVGYDYLGEFASVSDNGFNSIGYQDYVARSTAEMNKYGLTNPSAQGVNRFGFMSPRIIKMAIEDITTTMQMSINASYDLYQANLLPFTSEKNFISNPSNFDNETSLANRILNYEGISYAKLRQPISQIAAEYTAPPTSKEDVSKYFSDTDPIVFDNKSEEEANKGSQQLRFRAELQRYLDLVDNVIVRRAINDAINNYRPLSITDLNPIQGSFAYQQLSLDPQSVQSLNLFEVEINFNSIVKIEYFRGYNGSLTAPKWDILTPTQLSALNNGSGGPYLCRITAVDSLFNQPNIFKLDSFNEYFVLGGALPKTSMGLTSTYEPGYAQIRKTMKSIMSQPILNTNSAQGACFPRYTLSDEMIYESTSRTAQMPMPTPPPAASSTGGSY